MHSVFKIAWRNLLRYWRRTLLTAGLITVGVVAVLLFVALAGSFKALMIGQFTDSVLGHLEIHKKGYVASLDNLPLGMNMGPSQWERAESVLKTTDTVSSYSPRIKFGGLFSNYTETTNIRVNGIDPDKEQATVPLLRGRIIDGKAEGLLERGQILVPELMAKGMEVKVGDTVVVVATNRDGSVNGQNFVVRGVVSGLSGPGGRDAYIHIDDARRILRITTSEVSEVLVRLNSLSNLSTTVAKLETAFVGDLTPQGKPMFEVHGWDKLSPFAHIAKMIDLLTLFIKIMLVSIVLISIMNVMIMAVYERIREIGTISAIGTPPHRILGLFLTEGLLLGVFGSVVGSLLSVGAVMILNVRKVSFAFGQQDNIVLAPSISAADVVTACVVVIVVAMLASLQPAWKAARMDPIAALRHI